MEKVINSAIIPFVNQGKLSIVKINQLIALKDFIDRISAKSYIIQEVVSDIENRFGMQPDVISWGDFFQTELAMDAEKYTDEEFMKVVDTIRFDMMSAYQIFYDNKPEFYEWVETNSYGLINADKMNYNEEELEILHLKILKDYYFNLGIADRFTVDELMWYNSFSEEEGVIS